jgi:HPt (histidine-containing phosphotransfer) domain-containing protein
MSDRDIVVVVDEDLADIVPRFLDNRRRDVDLLRGAVADGDFEAVREIGHAMKGAGGGYGFDHISELGRNLENAGRQRQSQAAVDWIDELDHYLDRVRVVYE